MATSTKVTQEYGANPRDGKPNPLLRVITEMIDLETGACVRTFGKPDGTAERPTEREMVPPERLSELKRQNARDALRGVDPTTLSLAALQAYLKNRAIADGLLAA